MKKILATLMICSPFAALAADPSATVDLKFEGTLLQPTCTASFLGTAGNDIAFGALDASDIIAKTQDTIIPAAPVKDVFLKLANCGAGVTQVTVNFNGPSISGYGFSGRAPVFLNQTEANSGLGVALFTNRADTTVESAVKFKEDRVVLLSSMTADGANTYKWPLFAKMVVAKDGPLATAAAINTYSAGQDLQATAFVSVSYQ
ncbi:hypothetical protein CYR55_05140 [Chimaeribacter californicus]|uniref:Fimbrial protein n=1 Tax=Chimaeribacter californicus TaxID=2060067 RepID=A0A2N5EDP7_9GAMM|nr:hypothetical protein [Chimaeribacter californicus]PLR40668.1 hypothetical protein CYR55_05140 [Chimaeribacter californicus]